MVDQKSLFLLDGMSLIYRGYFALGRTPLVTSYGLDTRTIVGFIQSLWEMITKHNPTHMVVVFDTKCKTFRHELFEAYKSQRPRQPEDISLALPYIKALLDGLGIVYMEQEGYEADDVVGTLAKKATKVGLVTYIVSMDKDFAQLVDGWIHIYKPAAHGKQARVLNESAVLKEWSIKRSDQVVDILALAGDHIDGIPGVPSVGLKRAKRLIETYDHVENLLDHISDFPLKWQALFALHKEQLLLSKKLATICTQVPLAVDLMKDCLRKDPDQARLEEIFREIESPKLASRILSHLILQNRQQRLWD